MRELTGIVRSGKGKHARWMTQYADIYRAETGVAPFPGTLNVELPEVWRMPKTVRRFDAGVTILLVGCTIEGIAGFVIRTEKNEGGEGDHPLNVIEVISEIHLRDALGLKDGHKLVLALP